MLKLAMNTLRLTDGRTLSVASLECASTQVSSEDTDVPHVILATVEELEEGLWI